MLRLMGGSREATVSHMSLWADNEDRIYRKEMVDKILGILNERKEMAQILEGRQSLGVILGKHTCDHRPAVT